MQFFKATIFCVISIAVVGIGYALHWSYDQTAIAMLYLAVLWIVVEVEKLKEATGQPIREHRTKIIEQIERGKAVEPKHRPPHKPLNALRAGDDDDQMFRDFAGFANGLNKQLVRVGRGFS